jgi:hypothetical protein
VVDFGELMSIFSQPRPNGSIAEEITCQQIQSWLKKHDISYQLHLFQICPFFFESIGIWLILSRSVLSIAIWLSWGWITLPIAIIGLLVGTIDVALRKPLISCFGAKRGKNILIEFKPPDPLSEVVLSAHYDSKTEPLDHKERMIFLKNIPLGILLTLLLGFIGPLDQWLFVNSVFRSTIHWIGIFLTVPVLFLAWGLGINFSIGRWLKPSLGAVDNGAACAILLNLSERLSKGDLHLSKTRITLALFTGEEVNMQGSNAYVRSRNWPLPTTALNLEVMAQDGDYVFWEEDGDVFRRFSTSTSINQAICEAVKDSTSSTAHPAGPILSDGSAFLFAGLPTSVLGTYDSVLKDRGFHQPTDNLERVKFSRLSEGVDILTRFLVNHDQN